jgi:hypothetical protein
MRIESKKIIFLLVVASFLFAEEQTMLDEIVSSINTPPTEEEEPFDEEEFWNNYSGAITDVFFDNRDGTEYLRVLVPEKSVTEYHYLINISYPMLASKLTDLLQRITGEGYWYCSEIQTLFEHNEEIAIIYREDFEENTAVGEIRFPEFSMKLIGSKEPSSAYPNNIKQANALYRMIIKFIAALANVEVTLGYDSQYLLQFFKQ